MHRVNIYPSKHEALNQCCFNVGPPSTTLTQHSNNIGSMPRICLDYTCNLFFNANVFSRYSNLLWSYRCGCMRGRGRWWIDVLVFLSRSLSDCSPCVSPHCLLAIWALTERRTGAVACVKVKWRSPLKLSPAWQLKTPQHIVWIVSGSVQSLCV